jgi:acetolactate synthase-1/3 small subunit
MSTTAKAQRHLISVLVGNTPGVLARIVSLFSARGFNIESLNVGETENPQYSRMTITVSGDAQIIEQIRKQLEKLVDTLKVTSLTDADCV